MVLRGYRDQLARAKDPAARTRKAQPAVPSVLRSMLATLDRDTLIGKRDAALLLLGYSTAARVSELSALDLAGVVETEQGIDASVYRRKIKAFTDSAVVYGSNPATCPLRAVRALREAMADAGRADGPLFVRIDRHGRVAPPMFRRGYPIGSPSGRLTPQAAAQVVERVAAAAGLEGQLSGHSLRRGFATAARKAGHDLVRIGRHGGWADGSTAYSATSRTKTDGKRTLSPGCRRTLDRVAHRVAADFVPAGRGVGDFDWAIEVPAADNDQHAALVQPVGVALAIGIVVVGPDFAVGEGDLHAHISTVDLAPSSRLLVRLSHVHRMLVAVHHQADLRRLADAVARHAVEARGDLAAPVVPAVEDDPVRAR